MHKTIFYTFPMCIIGMFYSEIDSNMFQLFVVSCKVINNIYCYLVNKIILNILPISIYKTYGRLCYTLLC